MQKNQGPIVITELREALGDQEEWRIDCFGAVRRRAKHQAQHMVDLYLSPRLPLYSEERVLAPLAADSARQACVPVGVGYLPMLSVGSVFRGGMLVPQPPKAAHRVRLEFRPSTSTVFQLKEPINRFFRNEYARPAVMPSELAIGRRAWKYAAESLVVGMADRQGIDPCYVMVPCAEIARFFFCPSTVLARHLFSDNWEELLWRKTCDGTQLPRSVTIGLKTVKGLRLRDARHLAFYYLVEECQKAIHSIARSLQTSVYNRDTQPLECQFPFSEDTDGVAEVVEIATGTQLGKRYFVTKLISCKRPIPFEICYAHPMLHPGQGENRDDKDLEEMNIGSPAKQDEDKKSQAEERRTTVLTNVEAFLEDPKLGDQDGSPTNRDEQLHLETDDEERFTGLNDVTAFLSPKTVQQYKNAGGTKAIPQQATGASTGTPQGNKPIAGTHIEAEPIRSTDPTIKLLLDAVPLLVAKGHQAELLPPYRLAESEDPAKRQRRSWPKFQVGEELPRREGQKTPRFRFRSRLLVGVRIPRGDGACVVAEIERREEQYGLAVFYLDSRVDIDDFWQELADSVIENKGWPTFDAKSREYELQDGSKIPGAKGLHRDIVSAVDLADKIIRYL